MDGIRYRLVASSRLRRATLPTSRMQATTHLTVYAVVWLDRTAVGGKHSQQQVGSDCTLDGIRYRLVASSRLRRATLPTSRMQATTHLTVYAVVWLHRAGARGHNPNNTLVCDCTLDGIRCSLPAARFSDRAVLSTNMSHLMVYAVVG